MLPGQRMLLSNWSVLTQRMGKKTVVLFSKQQGGELQARTELILCLRS